MIALAHALWSGVATFCSLFWYGSDYLDMPRWSVSGAFGVAKVVTETVWRVRR